MLQIYISLRSYSLDHVVLVVGYNESENAFTVRNSWGPGWGENGYFRLQATPNNYALGIMYATDISIKRNEL